MALTTSAIVMALFGFVFLFGGLAVTLWIGLRAGGYGNETDESVE
jgi:hypothetical protein